MTQDDIEPGLVRVLDRRTRERGGPPYRSKSTAEVAAALTQFLAVHSCASQVREVRRMGGGASKEQFLVELAGERSGRYVLRMDPAGAVVDTDRQREFETLRALRETVPVPEAVWLDAAGAHFGQPAAIMTFVDGVTKPKVTDGRVTVTGLGTLLNLRWREILAPQFMHHLIAIHGFDWRVAALPSFCAPDADPLQAARWQVNLWARLWEEDKSAAMPMAALAESWMRSNLPACTDLVFVHADYRTGNYLFNEEDGRITSVLDWEFAHIGDHHEDLGWIAQRVFGIADEGRYFVTSLFERTELLEWYERETGRRVDRKTLHFYEVLGAYKCLTMCLATGIQAAARRHNHQDVLLTWLAAAGHIFHSELCRLLEE